MFNGRNRVHFSCLINSPEWNVSVFSFLLSFVWEIQQMPFYQILPELSCFNQISNCTVATVGDVGILLTAFWTVAAMSRSRQWFRHSQRWQVSMFVLVGVVITVIFEDLATRSLNIWAYADSMPTLPVLGTGLVPLLMWLIIPPLMLWFVQRQLR